MFPVLLASALQGDPISIEVRVVEVHVELGRVAWQRDHEAAFATARSSKKPVLLFFQEVPG